MTSYLPIRLTLLRKYVLRFLEHCGYIRIAILADEMVELEWGKCAEVLLECCVLCGGGWGREAQRECGFVDSEFRQVGRIFARM